MGKRSVLVAENDLPVQNLITATLRAQAIPCITTKTGAAAMVAYDAQRPDIVILDLGLPKPSGLEVISRLRSRSDVPIIVITSRRDEGDKLEALEAGADDYLIKPFSVEELLAHLSTAQYHLAQMRAADSPQTPFFNGALRLDYCSGSADLNGTQLRLTPIEYKLLCLLAQNPGKILTHRFMIQRIWGRSRENDGASLRVAMATLRKKLQGAPNSPQYIQTHIGVGYRMVKADRFSGSTR